MTNHDMRSRQPLQGLIPGRETGDSALSISTDGNRILLPGSDAARTSYEISGSGPGERTQSKAAILTNVVIPSLAFGQWTITVNAKNKAGTLIARRNPSGGSSETRQRRVRSILRRSIATAARSLFPSLPLKNEALA
jgi:hypothetical protein